MTYPFPPAEAPEGEKKTGKFKAWFTERKAAGLHWLLVLGVIVLFVANGDSDDNAWWFVGIVALAWNHIIPVVKWYYSVGTNPDGTKRKRNLRWNLGRFGIFAATATVFGVLWSVQGFQIAVILPVLIGISIPLCKKRDWTMLGAIWLGVFAFAVFNNSASIAAALLVFAVVQYERRKFDAASKKAQLVNRFDDLDLSQRPSRLGHPGGGLANRTGNADPYAAHPVSQPHPGTDTGVTQRPAPGAARDAALFGPPVQPPHQGDLNEEPVGGHTRQVPILPEDVSPPVRRRLGDPDARGTSAD